MSINDCDAISPLLALYVEGETDSTQTALVEKHLISCAACRCMVRSFRAEVAVVTDALRAAPPHRSITHRALAQLEPVKRGPSHVQWISSGLRRTVAVLAVLLLADTVELLWFSGKVPQLLDVLGGVRQEHVFALVVSSLFRTFC